MKKRIILLLLIICLAAAPIAASAGFSMTALAVTPDSLEKYTKQAETLRDLGLFLGTENGFELERAATRAEAAVMVVRLLGKESEARQQNPQHPFSDVPDWASAHVGYLYKNGISNGVSETEYGSALTATPNQFGTFLLRALGYSDAGGDFTWDASLQAMITFGIITNEEFYEYRSSAELPRAYAAALSYTCLFSALKNQGITLLEQLYYFDGAVSEAQMKSASGDAKIAALNNLYGIASQAVGTKRSEPEIYSFCHNAVFKIELFDGGNLGTATGSGFFISSDGYAVTNFHVIAAAASSGTVIMPGGEKYSIAGVIAFDPVFDLALIKVDAQNVPYLSIGDYKQLRAGDTVYAIGSPNGEPDILSSGRVQSINHRYKDTSFIRTTAPISPGSSGGALINEYGQVVGVTSAAAEDGVWSLSAPVTKIAELLRRSMLPMRYFFAHTRFDCIPFGNVVTEDGENDYAPVQTIPQDGIMAGNISSALDVDMYSLAQAQNGTLLVSLTGNLPDGGLLRFEIIDSGGTVVANSKSGEGELFSFAMCRALGGVQYTARVYSAAENSAPVTYELYYIWLAPVREEELYAFEYEPNDTASTADYMPPTYSFVGALQNSGDVDYYKVYIDTRGKIYADLVPLYSATSNFKLTLYNAETNEAVAVSRDNGEVVYVSFDNLPSGMYYIAVSAAPGVAISGDAGYYGLFYPGE